MIYLTPLSALSRHVYMWCAVDRSEAYARCSSLIIDIVHRREPRPEYSTQAVSIGVLEFVGDFQPYER